MMKNSKHTNKACIMLATAVFVLASFFIITSLNNSYAHSDGQEIPVLNQVKVSYNAVPAAAKKTDLIIISQYIPSIKIDMRYAGNNNIHGQKIYDDATPYLRQGTTVKLKNAQEEFQSRGYCLKIWDAYRPPRAQFKLWEICPDSRYIANPYKGYSNHSRGCAVDVTLVDEEGQEIEMPSAFDEFGGRADRNYQDVSPTAAANAKMLEEVMTRNGFTTIATEWWHFEDSEKKLYEVVEAPPLKEEDASAFTDWQPGNYQPSWLTEDENSRRLVDEAVKQGLIQGYGQEGKRYLGLNRYMSRAEFAVMLARVLNLKVEKDDGSDWYQPYISVLVQAGIITETSNQDWNRYIKREEMTQCLGSALQLKHYQAENREVAGVSSPQARLAIIAGLVNGDNQGNYNWQNNAERIHGIIVLMKLQQVLDLPPVIKEEAGIFGTGQRRIIISAVGDCTIGTDSSFPRVGRFDTTLKAVGNDYAYFFSKVRSILENDDLTIANLETTLTRAVRKADKGHQGAAYFFKGDPSYTEILKQGSIEAVNIANNHSLDYLLQGYQDTMSSLNKAGIMFFGYDKKAIASINGLKIGMLGYNVLGRLEAGINIGGLQKQIADDISALKQNCDLVIVSFHWGVEGASQVNAQQSALGHFVIDNGADLVLGHHPHIVQPVEKYKGKYIVYSLANFCFGGNHNPRDKDTFIYQQAFIFDNDNKLTGSSEAKIIPCSISSVSSHNNFCPTVVEGEDARRILQKAGLQAE